MDTSLYIEKDNTGKEGLDYYALRKQGVQYLQELCGTVWTDYNEHDPGITILEQYCYALTSLSYLAETPLQDLLCDAQTGLIDTRRQALFLPKQIYPVNPWTVDDYRRLLLDRVSRIGNVWLSPSGPGRQSAAQESGGPAMEGLYEVLLYVPEPADPVVIRQEVQKVYAAHRNLCEDAGNIRVLTNKSLRLYADVACGEGVSVEVLLAKIFFEVTQYMAPEIRRYSLEEMLSRNLQAADIFEGPLLRNGFIDSGDLRAKDDTLYVNRIEKVILGIPGIENIRNVYLQYQDELFYQKVSVPEDVVWTLDTRPPAGGTFTVRFFRKGVPISPDPVRVARELLKLYQVLRLRYKLDAQYEKFFPAPAGQHKAVENYYSIQNQFPMVYGINRFGLLKSDPPARKAMARQLKGYLLVFEQVMADYQAQLAHVRELFSTDPRVCHTYFYQGLADIVPHIRPVLKEGYQKGLKELVERMDPFGERRNRFLDFLLALYAETIAADAVSPYDNGCSGQAPEERLIRAKELMLEHLVTSTHDRGRAFNYQEVEARQSGGQAPVASQPIAPNIPGMEWKIRILLGMSVGPLLYLTEEFSARGFTLVESGDERLNRLVPVTPTPGDRIDNHYEAAGDLQTPGTAAGDFLAPAAMDSETRQRLRRTVPLYRDGLVDAEWITAGPAPDVYKIGFDQPANSWEWVGRQTGSKPWRTLGRFNTREEAVSMATGFAVSTKELCCCFNRLHIVEHILLRYALRQDRHSFSLPDEEDKPGSNLSSFPYSFHISVVISGCSDLIDHPGYRQFAERTVMDNTPAHIVPVFYWLRPWQMWLFELLYVDWRAALATPEKDARLLARLSRDLILFLHACRYPPQNLQR